MNRLLRAVPGVPWNWRPVAETRGAGSHGWTRMVREAGMDWASFNAAAVLPIFSMDPCYRIGDSGASGSGPGRSERSWWLVDPPGRPRSARALLLVDLGQGPDRPQHLGALPAQGGDRPPAAAEEEEGPHMVPEVVAPLVEA